ncbi:hypothetical protein [Tsukamurella sp. 1534]|uniref:hypothetical protein n=1 Tax=Tsukamurella sp. 1534 TaxID=1151061 RepID=UPI0002E6940B|nr:hypothetical protein [Tsukamurella sp. 1534]
MTLRTSRTCAAALIAPTLAVACLAGAGVSSALPPAGPAPLDPDDLRSGPAAVRLLRLTVVWEQSLGTNSALVTNPGPRDAGDCTYRFKPAGGATYTGAVPFRLGPNQTHRVTTPGVPLGIVWDVAIRCTGGHFFSGRTRF